MLQGYIRNLLIAGLTFISLIGTAVAAEKDLFTEGVDYSRVPDSIRNSADVAQLMLADSGKVQMLFFFSYGCHGCEIFNAPFEKWAIATKKKYGNKLVIYKYPVSLHEQWKMLAKLYYTMEFLDPSGKLNTPIFNAVHKEHLKMWQQSVMQNFFVQHGYTAEQFDKAFNSFGVNRQMRKADEISKIYKVAMTPEMVINGPYASYTVDFTKVDNDSPKLFRLLDYILKREIKLLN